MMIIFAGLPGTGKSTLALGVAKRIGGTVLDKDLVRAEMFGPDKITYTTEQDDVVMDEMLRRASVLVRDDPNKPVLIDGRVFSRNSQLKHVIEFADSLPTKWLVVECVCPEELAKQRLSKDLGVHVAANRTPDLYSRVQARFEPIPEPKIVVDTSQPVSTGVEQVLTALGVK